MSRARCRVAGPVIVRETAIEHKRQGFGVARRYNVSVLFGFILVVNPR